MTKLKAPVGRTGDLGTGDGGADGTIFTLYLASIACPAKPGDDSPWSNPAPTNLAGWLFQDGASPWPYPTKTSRWACLSPDLPCSPAKGGGCMQSTREIPLGMPGFGDQGGLHFWAMGLKQSETVLGKLLPPGHCIDSQLKHPWSSFDQSFKSG